MGVKLDVNNRRKTGKLNNTLGQPMGQIRKQKEN